MGFRISVRMLFPIASAASGIALVVALAHSASPARGTLVVANQGDHTLLLVDPDQRVQLAKITVGINGHEVTLSKDARFAYVPIYGNSGVGRPGSDGSTVDVVDLRRRKLATTFDLGKPLRPHRAEFGPDGLMYLTAELANAIDVIDTATGKVIAEIPTGQPQSHMLVLSPDGRRAYTANVSTGSISVLDLSKRNLIAVIPVAKMIQRISISPDGSQIFTQDQESPRIAIINTATNKSTDWIDLPSVAYASTPTVDSRWLLVASLQTNRLFVVDLQSRKVARSFETPQGPSEILVRPDGALAYVSCVKAGKIAVLDLRNWQMQEPITLSLGVDGLAWAPAPE